MRKPNIFALPLLMAVAAGPASAGPTQLGVYGGAGCNGAERIPVFDQWLGKPVVRSLDFIASATFANMVQEFGWEATCWQKANLGIRMTFAVPMLTNEPNVSLAHGAAGDYDEYYTQLGQILMKHGWNDAILRVGWEFNGGWYKWAAKKDPADWVTYFRRIVTRLRATPDNHFLIDWNPAIFIQQIPADQVYPGDQYVDVIGLDIYDQYWGPANVEASPELRWKAFLSDSHGLDWVVSFAKEHNKPISVPEWGVAKRADGHGGGDNPYFVEQMAAWFQANNVLYQNYFDFNMKNLEYKISNGQFPESAAAYKKAFGP
jgi:hypothetical protein